MKHSVPHDLGHDQAKSVARAALESYSTRFASYGPTLNWVNEDKANIGFTVKGVSLKGSLAVEPKAFDLELDVPFLLKPFSGKAVGVIEEEIKKWIGKSKAGEL